MMLGPKLSSSTYICGPGLPSFGHGESRNTVPDALVDIKFGVVDVALEEFMFNLSPCTV